jgi:hypothetical protein
LKLTPSIDQIIVLPTKQSLFLFVQMIGKMWNNLAQLINGNVSFGDGTNADNINGAWANVVTPLAPNTDFTINHNLNRIPAGYLVMKKDRAVDVYDGSIAATTTQITLKATVASAAIRLFILLLLLSFGITTQAQTTNVSATITDAGGQTWNNGTYVFNFNTGGQNPPFANNGSPYTPTPISGNLDGTGSFSSIAVPSSSTITPTGTKWNITVCPQATSTCFTAVGLTITGASQTISASVIPPAISINPVPGATAYVDAEVNATKIGVHYYNLTNSVDRVCTTVVANACTVWANAGGGVTLAGPNQAVQFNDNGALGGEAQFAYDKVAHRLSLSTAGGLVVNGQNTCMQDGTNCQLLPLGFGANVVVAAVQQGGSMLMDVCTVTSGTPNISCTGALWNSSMVGYLVRANTQSNGNAFATNCVVQSVTNATNAVVNCNASYSSGAASIGLYPRDETSTINSAIGTAFTVANCGAVLIPRGVYLITSAFANLTAGIPSSCSNFGNGSGPFFYMVGFPDTIQGKGVNLVIPADFDWTTCTGSNGSCFDNMRWSSLSIIGQDFVNVPASAANKTVTTASAQNFGVHHIGSPTAQTNFFAFRLLGNGASCLRCVFDNTGPVDWGGNFGTFSGYIEGSSYLRMGANSTLQISGNGTQINGVEFYAGGAQIFCSQGSVFASNTISAASTIFRSATTSADIYFDGCKTSASSSANTFFATGGNLLTVHATHSRISGTSTHMFNGPVNYFDDGGNTIASTVGDLASWTIASSVAGGSGDNINGACTGVATASQTLGLYGTGPNVTASTCTSTTIGSGYLMKSRGQIYGLVGNATAGGVNASSGLVTVIKNGADQTMTMTFGTGTTAQTTTNPVSFVPGDLISFKFTTQAAETLAGVKISTIISRN